MEREFGDALRFFDAIKPMRAEGIKKVRIGGEADGGYVMLEPKPHVDSDGIAFSLGIGDIVQWDLDMAALGYQVFQYDGTIDFPPAAHPLIKFNKFNIVARDPKQSEKTLETILIENGHTEKSGMILQIDIEGSEWDIFEHINKAAMLQFEQIIVEFHNILPYSENFIQQIKVLEKINETHQTVHIHGNNFGGLNVVCREGCKSIEDLFFIPAVIEVTYARKDDKTVFAQEEGIFPTELDKPNNPDWADLYFGVYINLKYNNYFPPPLSVSAIKNGYYTIKGFHPKEHSSNSELPYQWTKENDAEFLIYSGDKAENQAIFYIVKLTLRCAIENLVIFKAWETEYTFKILGDEEIFFPIRAGNVPSGFLLLSINTEKMFCPAEMPGWNSTDKRLLGVALREVKLLHV
jgi:hypothetical protein